MRRLIIKAISPLLLFGAVGLIGSGSALAARKCSAYKPSTYVVCIDNHRKETQTLWVIDGSGKTVYGPKIVTTSHVITDDKDSITCSGQWKLGTPLEWTKKEGEKDRLHYFIPFCGNQGLHYYKRVGWGYDSHGCIREDEDTAFWMYNHVGKAILRGQRAEINIMA